MLVMVVFFIAFRWIHLSTSLIRLFLLVLIFFSSRRRHTIFDCDWSSDVCSSDLMRLSEMKQLLAQGGLRLTKSLGQNFLHDANQLRRIVAAAELSRADKIGRASCRERV